MAEGGITVERLYEITAIDPWFLDQMQQIMLLKNVAVAGGFLFLVARGAGDWSLDAKRERLSAPNAHGAGA